MKMPLQDVRVRGLLGTTRLCLSFIKQLQSKQEVRVNLSESKHSSNSWWLHSYCGLTVRHHAEHSPEGEVKVHQHHLTLVTSDATGQSPLAVNSRTRLQEKYSALASPISCQPKVHFSDLLRDTLTKCSSAAAVLKTAFTCVHNASTCLHAALQYIHSKIWLITRGEGDWRVTIWISDLKQYWLVISDNIYTLQYTFISTTVAPLIIGNDRP